MLFKKKNTTTKKPLVKEIKLSKDYKFMYEVFLLTTQSALYLFLEEDNCLINALSFDFRVYKFGFPNDEVLGSHPMTKYGLGYYGIYEVFDSPWIEELNISNMIHDRPIIESFSNCKHFIVSYKDNTLDVICNKMEELIINKNEITDILNKEIDYIKKSN